MTVQEARIIVEGFLGSDEKINEALEKAIESIEELEQYRALGTVEELKEAREKQIPKKPIIDKEMKAIEVHYWNCPSCKTRYGTGTDMIELQHCHVCGQKIDWSEEE